MSAATADIGLIGLAVMGENLVLNMESHGYTVAVYNRTRSRVDEFLAGRTADDQAAVGHGPAAVQHPATCPGQQAGDGDGAEPTKIAPGLRVVADDDQAP